LLQGVGDLGDNEDESRLTLFHLSEVGDLYFQTFSLKKIGDLNTFEFESNSLYSKRNATFLSSVDKEIVDREFEAPEDMVVAASPCF